VNSNQFTLFKISLKVNVLVLHKGHSGLNEAAKAKQFIKSINAYFFQVCLKMTDILNTKSASLFTAGMIKTPRDPKICLISKFFILA
jgi:hypothetical protein